VAWVSELLSFLLWRKAWQGVHGAFQGSSSDVRELYRWC